jgi:hypothetical protein
MAEAGSDSDLSANVKSALRPVNTAAKKSQCQSSPQLEQQGAPFNHCSEA